MATAFTYGKPEKLKGRTLVQKVFSVGKSFTLFPLKIFYWQPPVKMDFYLKAGTGAGSRNFKKAVERNRIKRLLRDIYRTEKDMLQNYLVANKKQVAVFILYIDKDMPDYTILRQKIPLALQKLIYKINEESNTANT